MVGGSDFEMNVLSIVAILLTAAPAFAQRDGGGGQNPPLASLKTVAPPAPIGLDRRGRR